MPLIFLSLLFLLFFPLQPWDLVLLMPPLLPITPFLIFLFFVVLPPAAFPLVLLYTIHAMRMSPDLLANPLPHRSLIGAAAKLMRHRRMTRPKTLPLRDPRATIDIALALQAGTNRRLLLSEDMSAAFLGGCF